MENTLDVTSCLLDDTQSCRKMSQLSAASSGEHFMSRKRSIRERMREVEEKLLTGPKKPTPPSIFEAAAMIGKFSGQRIDLLSANIQNEFGVCGWILTILSYLLIIFTLPISACMCIKVVQEYERAVIFRLGRLMPGGAKGPGIFLIVPCIDTYRKVDLRVLSFEVPPQEILSKDSVTVAVDAVVYFRISNATISVTNVEDAARSTKLLAQTTLRNILGTKTLAEMLSDREAISHQMQSTLDEATEPWGVKVERVEVKDVRLPVQLQRAMAAEAEAAREARAKVIVAEGEQKASRALKEAAEVIAESPSAIQLRYLQTLNSISAEKNSTIIFPFPIDLLSAFLQRPAPKVEEPPALPKKIRSCCLYKYPDWVQGMVGEGKAPVSGGSQHQHPPSQHSHWHPPGGSGPSTTTTSGRPPLPLSMREAQYHLQVGQQGNTTATPSQLDPGSLLDSSRRGSRGPARGAGANSLLKQAIANRLKEEEKKDDETKMDRGEAEMSRSIVGNPAWYRDDEGRTGFKPREWENLPNQQKDQVKKRREKKNEESGTAVAEIDRELLKEKEPVEEERELTKEEKKVLKKKEKEEKKEEEKRKKEEKRREKEEKKRLEKEEKERKKSQTSLDKVEREKPETGLQEGTLEMEKRRSKSKERESDAVSREKKEKMRREKENSTERTEGTGDDKLRDKKERRQEKGESHRTREHLGPERESSMGRDSTDHLNREPRESRGERHKRKGHPDQGSESTDKREKSRDREQRRYSDTKGETHQIREHSGREESHKTREPSERDRETRHSTSGHRIGRESRDQSSPQFDSHQKEPTAKIDNPTLRRDSNTSAASSTKSTDTVRHHPVSGKPPRHPSIESSKTPVQSSPSSSNEEDRRAMILAKPRRTNIGERRDSSMSESSRISAVSHKSVTFSDRVQTHEIERIVLSSSDDDVGVMSDDELSKPDSERRRKLVRMLQEQGEATDSEEEDDFEEQERLIEQRMLEEQMMSQGIYPVYNLNETSSQNSMYPEELDPDRYLLEEDGSYISLDKLPAAVRRAIIADMTSRPRDDEINMGSMSKLHEEGPYSPGLVRSHEGTLPRSASGYLDEQYMIQSYQQAMYGAFHPDDRVRSPGDQPSSTLSPPQGRVPRTLGERRQLHQLHESFYDNVPSRTSSLIGVPVETRESVMPQRIQERRGSEALERAGGGELVTPVPSPPRRGSSTSIERRAFFESMNPSIGGVHAKRDDDSTPTPSPPRVIVSQPAAGQPQQRLRVTTTTTSTMQTNRTEILEKESRNEDDMRRRFVKQFGANRKAPRAEEEDPLDPGPTSGSRESIYSTDSRESVVSEASIRKENFVRRNFNY